MKRYDIRKLWAAVALALILCLAMPAALPARAATTVKLNKTKATLYVGQTLQLKLANATGTVKWTTSDKAVATVSTKGKVTAKKAGSATITAASAKKKYTCRITVKKGLTTGSAKLELETGKSKTVTVTQNVAGKVSITSSNSKVATAKWKGTQAKGKNKLTIKAVGAGTATITLKNAATKETLKIKVTAKKPNQYFVLEDKSDQEITAYYNPMAVLHPPFKVGLYLHTDGTKNVDTRIADESVVSCEVDGDWEIYGDEYKDYLLLYVYPEKAGTTTITLSNSANEETIKIKVTVAIDNSFYGY